MSHILTISPRRSFNPHGDILREAAIPVFQMWKLRLTGLHLLQLSHPVDPPSDVPRAIPLPSVWTLRPGI